MSGCPTQACSSDKDCIPPYVHCDNGCCAANMFFAVADNNLSIYVDPSFENIQYAYPSGSFGPSFFIY
jgi:hypothetical protein